MMDETEFKLALEEIEEEKKRIWLRKLDGELSYSQACDEYDKLLVRKRTLIHAQSE